MTDSVSISQQEFDDWKKHRAELSKLRQKEQEWESAQRTTDEYNKNQQDQINRLEHQIKEKDRENQRVRREYKSNEDGRIAAEQALQDAEAFKKQAENQLDAEKKAHDELRILFEQLREDLQKMDYLHRQSRNEYWELHESKELLMVDLETLMDKNRDVEKELANIREDVQTLTSARDRLAGVEDMLQEQFGQRSSQDISKLDILDITKLVSEELQSAVPDVQGSPDLLHDDVKLRKTRSGLRSTSIAHEMERTGHSLDDDATASSQASPELDRKRRSIDSSNALSFVEDDSNHRTPKLSVFVPPRTLISSSPQYLTEPLPLSLARPLRLSARKRRSNTPGDLLVPYWLVYALILSLAVLLLLFDRLYHSQRTLWLAANEVTRQEMLGSKGQSFFAVVSPKLIQSVEAFLQVEHKPMG